MSHQFTTNSFDRDTFILFIIVEYIHIMTNLSNLISAKLNVSDITKFKLGKTTFNTYLTLHCYIDANDLYNSIILINNYRN